MNKKTKKQTKKDKSNESFSDRINKCLSSMYNNCINTELMYNDINELFEAIYEKIEDEVDNNFK
jgi:hypothetical protein